MVNGVQVPVRLSCACRVLLDLFVLTPFLARVLGLLRPNRPQPSRVLLPLLDARAETVGLFQFPAPPRPGLVPEEREEREERRERSQEVKKSRSQDVEKSRSREVEKSRGRRNKFL